MSPLFTLENFLNNHGSKLHKIFERTPLNHQFNFENQLSLLKTIDVEIRFTQKTLQEMGDENLIKSIYQSICYSNYLEAIEQKRSTILSRDFFSYELLQDFMERLTNHQNLCQRDGNLYESRTRNDIRFFAEGKRIGAFIEFLNKTGFDNKKYNYSYLFLILLWVKLEILMSKLDGFVKVIRQNGIEIHLIQDPKNLDADLVSFLNLDIISSYKECLNCYRAYHYLNPMFVHKESEAMQFFASLSRKDMIKKTQRKGCEKTNMARRQENEALAFFWQKCKISEPEALHKVISAAIFGAAKKRDEIENNAVIKKLKDGIINLGEEEKLKILERSLQLTENSIPDRVRRWLLKENS